MPPRGKISITVGVSPQLFRFSPFRTICAALTFRSGPMIKNHDMPKDTNLYRLDCYIIFINNYIIPTFDGGLGSGYKCDKTISL
jgi:hypothetical protein